MSQVEKPVIAPRSKLSFIGRGVDRLMGRRQAPAIQHSIELHMVTLKG
jgi:hypothetical protein